MTDLLADLRDLIEQAGGRCALIGGHAVNVWLEPRVTADIDLTVVATPAVVQQISDDLTRRGWSLQRQVGADQPSGPDFLRFEGAPDLPPIDLQISKMAFQHQLVGRAYAAMPPADPTPAIAVATVEDLIVLKLIAYRTKDMADLLGLAQLEGVDWSHVESLCADWDLGDRLAWIRQQLSSVPR
jgi:hypothetical protein